MRLHEVWKIFKICTRMSLDVLGFGIHLKFLYGFPSQNSTRFCVK